MATDSTDADGNVIPLERRAFFDIDTREGYVRIDQSVGDPTLYTPEEARDIAESILDAVGETESGRDPTERDG
jgi:hypothetical protein